MVLVFLIVNVELQWAAWLWMWAQGEAPSKHSSREMYYDLAPSHNIFQSSESALKLHFREMCATTLKV